MSWNQITLDVPDDLTDAVVGELSDDGVAGVWESAAAQPGRTRLILYFNHHSNLERVESRLGTIFDRLRLPLPAVSRSVVEECDWTGEWKKSYTSFPIGTIFSSFRVGKNPAALTIGCRFESIRGRHLEPELMRPLN